MRLSLAVLALAALPALFAAPAEESDADVFEKSRQLYKNKPNEHDEEDYGDYFYGDNHHNNNQGGSGGGNCGYSFVHGVASGDPRADRVIIWTRLTPSTLPAAGTTLQVRFWVARDKAFRHVVTEGYIPTTSDDDYTVKRDITGLRPYTRYYFKFEYECARSMVGRTKTLPAPGARTDKMKFAFFSCSNWPQGYFHAYDAASKMKDLDFVVHLGDSIYEYTTTGYVDISAVRAHDPDNNQTVTLQQYRARHAQYKTDMGSIRMLARHPLIIIWDDHESANNPWFSGAQNHNPRTQGNWFDRKEASVKAFFEYNPIRPPTRIYIYRQFQFGDLASLFFLEDRLYARTEGYDISYGTRLYDQYLGRNGTTTELEARQNFYRVLDNTSHVTIGDEEYNQLTNDVRSNPSIWQVFGTGFIMARQNPPRWNDPANPQAYVSLQEVISLLTAQNKTGSIPFATRFYNLSGAAVPSNLDEWDGYRYEREKIFDMMQRYAPNPVVISGDSHCAWAFDLQRIFPNNTGVRYGLDNPYDKVGVEFAGPSVTSIGYDGTFRGFRNDTLNQGWLLSNPHMVFTENSFRGFVVVEANRKQMTGRYYKIVGIRNPTDYSVNCYVDITVKAGRRQFEPVRYCDGRPFQRPEFGNQLPINQPYP